jgi:peptidylprolyl isomerase
MRMRIGAVLTAMGCLAMGAGPLPSSPPASSSSQIVAGAPASAWQAVPDQDVLVMTLGNGGRVVIQLAPSLAPVHVANIRALARAGWWNGGRIVRVQDNYVVQWSNPHRAPALPAGVVAEPPAEYERALSGVALRALGFRDSYAAQVGYADGWPVGDDGTSVWPVHCYGMVGVGRDLPPDTGSGVELYAVNGQAPRHLDRNIALAGRVIEGMALLSALPRGTEALGFYKNQDEGMAIRRVALAADLPGAQRPHFQMMRVGSPAFGAYLDARANRRDAFFVRPAGAVDICNAPVPVREVTAAR